MKNFLWITTTLLWLGVAMVSGFAVLFLPMLFDAPGSQDNRGLQAMAVCIAAMPVLFLMAATMPWIYKHKRYAGWLFLLPFLGILAIFLAFFVLEQL